MGIESALNIADFRELARRRLPRGLFEFIERGNEDDIALRNNRTAFERIKLRPRVLNDVSQRDQSVSIFEKRWSMPVAIAPTGPPGYMWYRGEVAFARAATKAGIPVTFSTAVGVPMEEIMRDGGSGAKWWQLYASADRQRTLQTVERAKAAGYETLVFTVDSVFSANREFVVRSGFAIPFRLTPGNFIDILCHPRWLISTIGRYVLSTGIPELSNYPIPNRRNPAKGGVDMKDPSMTWELLRTLRAMWPGKLVVKGILDPRDAVLCAQHGADGVIVSNHGAVMVDSSMAPIDVLPEILHAVGGKMAVFVDGGIRRGSDVVKAIALGATAVFIGRAGLYALAAGGEAGASRALALLSAEIDRTLAALGCRSFADVTRDHVILPGDPPLRAAAPTT